MIDYAALNLRINNNQFNAGIDQSSTKLGRLAGIGKSVAVGLGAMFVGSKIASGTVELVKMASTANETANKFKEVFSGVGSKAETMAYRFAKSFDLANSSAKALLSSTGDILTGFGFADDKALQLSLQVNRLAGDLSSFQNVSMLRATEALTKLLVGETESAKMLGIVIRQDTAEFKNMVSTLMETQGLTLNQAKAQTMLNLAYKQSPKAVGDYARTQYELANRIRATEEAWKGLKESMGNVIIQGGGVSDIMNNVVGVLNSVKGIISSIPPGIGNFIIKTGALVIGIGALKIGIDFVRMALAAKSKLLAVDTANTVANTGAIVANSEANAVNAVSVGKLDGRMSRFLQKGASMLGSYYAKLDMLPRGLSGIAKGASTAALGVGVFFAAFETTKAILAVTGLDKVLEYYYAKWFTNIDEAKAKGKDLDRQLAEYNKKRWGKSGRPQQEQNTQTTVTAQNAKASEKELKMQQKIADINRRDEQARFEHNLSMMTTQQQIEALRQRETDTINKALNASDKVQSAELYSAAQALKFRRESLQYQLKEAQASKSKSANEKQRLQEITTKLKSRNDAIQRLNTPTLESNLTDAIEKGSVESMKLASMQVSNDKQITEHTKNTAKNTKDLIDEAKKIVKKLANMNNASDNRDVVVMA